MLFVFGSGELAFVSAHSKFNTGPTVLSTVLAALLASIVLFSRAQIVQSSFEEPLSPTWKGPEGGGTCGGFGEGCVVSIGKENFVRSGKHAVKLTVGDNGNPDAMAWAGVMQTLPCEAGRKVRVGAWLYYSSALLSLHNTSQAQLKIEYFEDNDAKQLLPGHIFLSTPFNSATYKPDTWHLIEAFDRVPQNASSMKFSIVVTSQKAASARQAIWLDDMFVDMQAPRPAGKRSAPGKT
jgi:hypothetical protein